MSYIQTIQFIFVWNYIFLSVVFYPPPSSRALHLPPMTLLSSFLRGERLKMWGSMWTQPTWKSLFREFLFSDWKKCKPRYSILFSQHKLENKRRCIMHRTTWVLERIKHVFYFVTYHSTGIFQYQLQNLAGRQILSVGFRVNLISFQIP